MMKIAYKNRGCAGGMSLVELLVAIGILGVAMTLIGAAFPAGVIMSIAVSDESTSQTVFQKAVGEIKSGLQITGTGHGIGLTPHEQPRIGQNSAELLTSGMVFTIEPGIYLTGWGGVRIEDMVVWESGKIRVITKTRKV